MMKGNRRRHVGTKPEGQFWHFAVPYEKDTTIESDSKQRMMPRWNRTELGSTRTKLEIEAPQCQ